MKKTNALLLVILGVASVTSCGLLGDSEKSLTNQSFCDQRAEAECAKLTDCSLTAMALQQCRTARAQTCLQETASSMQATGRRIDRDNAEACLAETKSKFTVVIPAANWTALRQKCARVFEGTVKETQACTADLDCDNGLVCDKGACGVMRTVATLKGCANPGETCPAGEYCANEQTRWTCKPRLAQGAACDAANRCLESLRCLQGTCQPGVGLSGACSADADCAAPAICDPLVSKCVVSVILTSQCESYSRSSTTLDGGTNG